MEEGSREGGEAVSAKISLLAMFATAYGVAFGAGFDLDWCTAYDTGVPYEVEISTNKLARSGLWGTGCAFRVKSQGNKDGGTALPVAVFEGKM